MSRECQPSIWSVGKTQWKLPTLDGCTLLYNTVASGGAIAGVQHALAGLTHMRCADAAAAGFHAAMVMDPISYAAVNCACRSCLVTLR